MTSNIATPKKRGRPAKAKASSTIPTKAQEIPITIEEENATVTTEESSPKVPEIVEAKKKKSSGRPASKVKQSLAEKNKPEPEQHSDVPQVDSEENSQASTPKQPEAKTIKAEKKEKALPSKEKNTLDPSSVKGGARSKSETSSNKNTQKPNSNPTSTLKNGIAIRKKPSIAFELEPMPLAKDIIKWASKYKEGLLIKEKDFTPPQVTLSTKVQTALSKQGLSASNKKLLESLDDFLFGKPCRIKFENGLDVSTLWLVTSWRYLRGTFKPSVLGLVKSNEDQKVQKATKEIYYSVKSSLDDFQKAKKADDVFCIMYKKEISNWVASLSTISGLSAVTATAILGMITDEIPYMSEEGLLASLGTNRGSHEEATLVAYLEYVGSAVKEFGRKLTPKEIEAGWYYHSFKP